MLDTVTEDYNIVIAQSRSCWHNKQMQREEIESMETMEKDTILNRG